MYMPSPRKVTMEDDEYIYELIDPSVTFSTGGFNGGYQLDARCWNMNVTKKEVKQPMKIYYIRYRDDNPEEDGIWLFSEEDKQQFYATVDGATAACKLKNEQERVSHEIQKEKARVQWELNDVAYRALERAGIDASKSLRYHKPGTFEYREFLPTFVVDQIEVKE